MIRHALARAASFMLISLVVGAMPALAQEPLFPGTGETPSSLPDPPLVDAHAASSEPDGQLSTEAGEGSPGDSKPEQTAQQATDVRTAPVDGSGADAPPHYVLATGKRVDDEWARGAHFFGGLRSGVGFAPGGSGPAGTLGLELGVSARRGLGFGLHLFGIANPPEVTVFDIPRAEYGMGAAADVRWYIQTIRPLTVYPTMSLGFMAGPSADNGENAVMPMINPGFGARVNIADVYVAFEIGAANFYIPFVNISVGWEPQSVGEEG